MKMTVDLPDDLVRALKIRAAVEGRRLREVIADLIRTGLAQEALRPERPSGRGVSLPLVHCAHPATPDEEMTPERVAEILANDEMETAGLR
jgi:metal-responsive CopG/Arc/MetJ family transcriptional regulator